jgi:hypothetical protein
MDDKKQTRIEKITNRQLARFLNHLEKTGSLTPELEVDVKRAYRFYRLEMESLMRGNDKENEDDKLHSESKVHGSAPRA